MMKKRLYTYRIYTFFSFNFIKYLKNILKHKRVTRAICLFQWNRNEFCQTQKSHRRDSLVTAWRPGQTRTRRHVDKNGYRPLSAFGSRGKQQLLL